MYFDDAYFSLGISPNAEAFVMQSIVPSGAPWAGVVYAGSISELDSRGHAEAVGIIGCLTLGCMQAYFPLINMFAESLIPPIRFEPLAFDPGRERSGSKRDLHLRIHTSNPDQSLIIRRFNNCDSMVDETLPVMLEPLMVAGPEAVADFIGTSLLAEITALHPGVFAAFPALMGDRSG